MSCTETGTIGGTIMHSEKWNDQWNAERRKPAPMLAFQRNDTWNETRIPTLERSNPPLEGGPVERAERFHVVVTLKPAPRGTPKGTPAGLVVPRSIPGAHDRGRGWVESSGSPASLTGRLPIRGFFLGGRISGRRGVFAQFRDSQKRAPESVAIGPKAASDLARTRFLYKNRISENAPELMATPSKHHASHDRKNSHERPH